MCECVNDIEKRSFDKFKNETFNNKPVVNAEFLDIGFGVSGSAKTFSRLGLELQGQKKRHEINFIHSYCPFCGEKYPEVKK